MSFYALENEEILDALTDYREDEDEVLAFLGGLGFDVDNWTHDAQ